jgi:hypothetical protein
MSDLDTNTGGKPKREKKPGTLVLLTRRWDEVAERARKAGWTESQTKISSLAELVGLKWHSTYRHDFLSEVLAYDGVALTKARYIGPSIIAKLCEIVERSLEMTGDGNQVLKQKIEGGLSDPRKTLANWQVPLDLPCRLMMLSERLQRICRMEWNVRALGDLLELMDSKGLSWVSKCRNLGPDSVAELERFINSLKDGNRSMASMVLPLDDSGKGLSLSKALEAQLDRMSPSSRRILELSLGEGLSDAFCAQHVGVSSSYIGMVRKTFVQATRDWIGWFGCYDVEDAMAKLRPSGTSLENELVVMAVQLAFVKRGRGRQFTEP